MKICTRWCFLVAVALLAVQGSVLGQKKPKSGKKASFQSSAVASSDNAKGSARLKTEVASKGGNVKLEAAAFSESIEETRSALIKIRVTAVESIKSGQSLTVARDVAVKAAAKAVAKTLTTVFIRIESTGKKNQACADTSSSAKAKARSLAEVFVDVFVQAENAKSIADSRATVKSVSAATAKAASKASAAACLDGKGSVTAFQESFANAVTEAYASVIAKALGEVTADGARAESVSKSNAGTTDNVQVGGTSDNVIAGKGTSTSDAEAFGDVKQIKECTGRLESCCAKGIPKENRCRCGLRCAMKATFLGGNTYGFELTKAPKGFKRGQKCICNYL